MSQNPMNTSVLGKILAEAKKLPKGTTIRITKLENEIAVDEMKTLFESGYALDTIPAIGGNPIEVIE